jgi:hypothetical protein
MIHNQHEILVLKPTPVFLSFLAAQVAEPKLLPDYRLLQIDNTAYILQKKASEDAILNKIEKHFSWMFHYEMSRWLGDEVYHEIEGNFLDFLCCFKLELHNHIILMESLIEKSHQLLLIKPRIQLLNWIKKRVEGDDDLAPIIEKVKLTHLEENATALVKNFSNLAEIKPFIRQHYRAIFSKAMNRLSSHSREWPSIDSFQSFCQYFMIEVHTKLKYLSH